MQKTLALLLWFVLFRSCLYAQITWISGKTHDFGTITEGKEVSHSFAFRNDGSDTLTIETTRTTCGCTGTVQSDKPVAPGQNGSVTVIFDGQVPLGNQFKKKVQVYFHQRRKAEVLKIYGEVSNP
jgi:Protein of unknown function (DUF1573)